MAITTAVETITPEQAKRMLGGKNRTVRPSKVAMWARAMLAGKWVLNGETMKVSEAGALLDGAHRCLAVIESGASIEAVVVRGLPDTAQETIDIGEKRSLGDVLHLRGEPDGRGLAACLTQATMMEMNGEIGAGAGYVWPGAAEMLAFLEAHPDVRESARKMSVWRKTSHMRYPVSLAAGLHFWMSQLDADEADGFWSDLTLGASLPETDSVAVLRRMLIDEVRNQRRMDSRRRAALTVKAWNYRRDDRPVQVMAWRRSGPTAEPFPRLR